LKPGAFKLWVKLIQLVQPHQRLHGEDGEGLLDVASGTQVDPFEEAILKAGDHISGSMIESPNQARFQALWVNRLNGD
jgi:hypothetical protein